MTDRDNLEDFFAAGRQAGAEPSEALMRRVMEDAGREQALAGQAAPVTGRRYGSRIAAWIGELGGWPAMAGLAAATVAGLWIGAEGALGDFSVLGDGWDVDALSSGYAELTLEDG